MAFAIGAAITAAGAIGGGLISSSANKSAAKDQANAIREAANTQAAATRDAITARNQALAVATDQMIPIEQARVGGSEDLARVQESQGSALASAMRTANQAQGATLDAYETFAGGTEQGMFNAAADTLTGAGDRGIAAVTAGQGQVEDLFRPVIGEAADTYNPGYRLGLTPNQTIAREDLLRRARGVVAASGLRGAGRGGVATILDADRRFLAQAADTNDGLNRDAEKANLTLRQTQRTRADAARSALASSAMTTGQSISNLETRRGEGVANIRTAQGGAQAASTRRRGEIASTAIRGDLDATRTQLAADETAAKTRVAGRNAFADDRKWYSGLGLNTASQNANTISAGGDDQARALTGIGAVNANSTTANAGLGADLIGRIGALGGDYLERYLKANPSGGGNAGLVRDTDAGMGA